MKMGRFCVIGILVIIVSAQVRQRFAYTNYTIPCVLGTSCILPCKMDPYQKNASVSWLNSNEEYLTRGKTIINPDSTYLGIEKSANNTWNLHNKNVTRNFAGTYKCEAKIGSKQMTLSVVTLVIESKPTLDERNSSGSNSKFKEGEDAELNCVFDGSPAPEIKWHRGRSMEIIEGLERSKLIIRNVTRYSQDNYKCNASNKHGSAISHMFLTVEFGPEVSVVTSLIRATEHENVIMRCIVQASPMGKAYWKFEGKKININTSHIYELEENQWADDIPVKLIQLKIKLIRKNDQGNYTCHGSGKDGNHEETATVQLIMGD